MHFPAGRRFLRYLSVALTLTACALAPTAHARLGETLAQMKDRLGKAHPAEKKNSYLWYFEVIDGPLAYVVTFNDQGRSIAEGIRPVKRARFTPDLARDFIAMQTKGFANSPTLRTLGPDTPYTFAGRKFTSGPEEAVVLDETHGVLIIWTKGPIPSILAVSPEMILQTHP